MAKNRSYQRLLDKRSAKSGQYEPLDPKGCLVLADALGDSPETVISVHALRRGYCRAYVAGDPARFGGVILQGDFCPAEPMGFGADPKILWEVLKSVDGWDCVDVDSECATALGEIIERETGKSVRYYRDVYHTLLKPAVVFRSEFVRQLTVDDLELLESALKELCGGINPLMLLSEGIIAGAIVSGRIVATAGSYARTDRYADIGAFTMEEWRRHGFATASASIVAKCVQEAGLIPVWSTGEGNVASLRVAQKLGFTKVSRRTYVIRIK